MLTDYYPASSTLLMAWRLIEEESPFMAYFVDIFESVVTGAGALPMTEYLDTLSSRAR